MSIQPRSNFGGHRTVQGPQTPPLWTKTLSTLLDERAATHGDRDAVVVPWQSVRLSYRDLADRSILIARVLLASGLQHGDTIGIMAGNRSEYVEVFAGAGRIGCIAVVLNNTYSPEELMSAVTHADCKMVFIASHVGTRSLEKHIANMLHRPPKQIQVVSFSDSCENPAETYQKFLSRHIPEPHFIAQKLKAAENKVAATDVLNLQFTSGTTGKPKAACLTHSNVLNNARFVGAAMELTEADVVCCPPPLYHCFGLVMGFLASVCYGSSIVFPSDKFEPEATLRSVTHERATALLGVPTMFISQMEVLKEKHYDTSTVRTGMVAGAMASPALMKHIHEGMGIHGMLIAYGMTETSPVTFITSLHDSLERRSTTIGRVLPHTAAKVVDAKGNALPLGHRGELCTAGFALQKGYWKDDSRTREVMKVDEHGVRWMHTGDEGFIDTAGYGHVTGRIKDLIIRGGENISPSEIEDRLMEHTSIGESCVVGLEDAKYGEVIGAFVSLSKSASVRPTDNEIKEWISQSLGRVKEPRYIFWVGDPGVGPSIPKTGSGKYQKHLVRALGNRLVKEIPRARL